MKKITAFFSNSWPFLLITVISIVLAFANVKSGTYLLGWDSTVPEFNLGLNLQRFLFGVWQGYRGLGTLDGMAHTANSVYWVYTSLLSAFFPQWLVRYASLLSFHWLGGIGAYLFTKKILKQLKFHDLEVHPQFLSLSALVAALVYQYNFMTIQMFYIPLELFAIHFALIPWGLWSLWRYLEEPTVGNAWVWLLINLAGVSQAHVPSIFIPYAIIISIQLLVHFFAQPRKNILTVVIAGLLLIATNSFWGLPYIFSALNKAPEISASMINTFSTDDISFRNQAWGTLWGVASFGGFNIDYLDWDYPSLKTVWLLKEWREYYQAGWLATGGITLSVIAVVGLIGSLLTFFFRKKLPTQMITASVISALIMFTLMATDTFLFKNINQIFRDFIPFFGDIFRFTFTKFSQLYVFHLSLFVGVAPLAIFLLLKKFTNLSQLTANTILSVSLVSIAVISIPSFLGHFFYGNLQHSLPEKYSQTITFFNNQPSQDRVLVLPSPSFYGWTNTSWGYRGSGYLWQAIPQSMIDRSFDPWSKKNETLYLQLQQAIAQQNQTYFQALLERYNINWIFFDDSIFEPSLGEKQEVSKLTKAILANSDLIAEANFEGITIYRTSVASQAQIQSKKPTVALPSSYPNDYQIFDPSIFSNEVVKSTSFISNNKIYPFANVTTNDQTNPPISISDNLLTLRTQIDAGNQLRIPTFDNYVEKGYTHLYAKYINEYKELELSFEPYFPTIHTNHNTLSIPNKNVVIPISSQTTPSEVFIRINKKIYKIKLEANEQYIGAIPINFNEISSLSLFNAKAQSTVNITNSLINERVQSCWQHPNKPNKISKDPVSLKIFSTNASGCVTSQLSFESNNETQPNQILIGISLDYLSDGAQPQVCFREKGETSCLNGDSRTNLPITDSWNSTAELVMASTDQAYSIDFINSVTKNDQEQSLEFTNIQLLTFQEIFSQQLDFSEEINTYFANFSNFTTTNYSQPETINISFNLGSHQEMITQEFWNQRRGMPSEVNCDFEQRGQVERAFTDTERIMTAQNKGALCDQISYETLSQYPEYLVHFKGKVSGGVGMKLSLSEENSNLTLLNVTTGDSDFNFWKPLVVPNHTNGTLNAGLTITSYGSEKNEVKLENLEFLPLPIHWLSAIHVDKKETTTFAQGNIIKTNVVIPLIYRVVIEKNSENVIISLNESFDKGWIAINLSTQTFLSPILLENWQQGWIVNSSNHDGDVLIVYWPQLLSYVGYVLLIIVILLLVFFSLQSKNS